MCSESPIYLAILEVMKNCPEGRDFGMSPEETEVTHAEEALPYNKLPDNENHMSCSLMGPATLWESTWRGRPLCGVR